MTTDIQPLQEIKCMYAALSVSQVVYNNGAQKVTNDVGQIN